MPVIRLRNPLDPDEAERLNTLLVTLAAFKLADNALADWLYGLVIHGLLYHDCREADVRRMLKELVIQFHQLQDSHVLPPDELAVIEPEGEKPSDTPGTI